MQTEKYFQKLKEDVEKVYIIANEARAKGLDPAEEVEIPLAMSMAEKVVGLISAVYPQVKDSGISKRILELEKEYGKLDSTIIFKIAEEVARQKFCSFDNLVEAMDAGIRIGFAYATLAVVSSPIEGFTGLKVRKTRDNKDYIEASFSGPIRSAGTTASCLVLMLIDFLRELFGFVKYDPTEDEVKRTYTELLHFHERITNLQYMPTEEEALFLARHLPIQIAGEPSERIEVPNYKNLARVDTNFLRSGFCLIIGEGLAQKAAKGLRMLNNAKKNGIKSTGFEWLKDYVELHERKTAKVPKEGEVPTYLKDLVAGRPIFGHPGKSGGFRFRYGRSRVSGFSAVSMHPATMAITDNFIATGTQLKIEKPTKGCAVTPCENIDGPIVKLFSGSVRKLKTKKEAEACYKDIEEIIYLGDILFPFSDVANRNAKLVKPGYVDEWWLLELREKDSDFEINPFNVEFEKAAELSTLYNIPLHPAFIFYWNQISAEQFEKLLEWLSCSWVHEKIIFPYGKTEQEKFSSGKRALELLGIEHEASTENIVLTKENSKALLANLGIDDGLTDKREKIFLKEFVNLVFEKNKKTGENQDVLESVNSFSKFIIKDKAGEFIGARMGRPEKAKLRKLKGSPNALFPVGKEGGRLRSVQEACKSGKVTSTFPKFSCAKCQKETIYLKCEICGEKTKKSESSGDDFSKENGEYREYQNSTTDISPYFREAVKKTGLKENEVPVLIKGIRGTSSKNHLVENLAKGILRAGHNLQVNKDGTIRMDATELPLTHFKPKEISTSVEKLKEMGYDEDIYGKPLENPEQILELMPHDVILPRCRNSTDEKADELFFRVSKFVDAELEKFYGAGGFYNFKSKEELVGHLGVCMAPHNCAGVICRFIGFSNTQGLFASPYMHAAVRRDCLSADTLINICQEGSWKSVPIGQFAESFNPNTEIDRYGTKIAKLNGSYKTITLNPKTGKTELNKIKEVSKHAKRQLIKINFENGRDLCLTPEHQIYLKTEGGIIKKPAFSLSGGDEIISPHNISLPEEDAKSIDILDIPISNLMIREIGKKKISKLLKIRKQKKYKNFLLRDSYPLSFFKENKMEMPKNCLVGVKRDNVSIPRIIKISNDLLWCIGLYIAEGNSRKNTSKKGFYQIQFAAQEKYIRQRVMQVFKKIFRLKPSCITSDAIIYSSRIIYELFTNYFGCGANAHVKKIPSMFISLPKSRLKYLLQGYFDGDGSVSLTDNRVACDSVSPILLENLYFCLARYGIYVKRQTYTKKPGPLVRKFYERKNRKIPEFAITKLTIPSNFTNKFYKEISFALPRKKNILKKLARKKPEGIRVHLDGDNAYLKVLSVEVLPEQITYCLNVENNHNFIAGDIFVSNCDGDEIAVMLLGDVLINFSREFLPGHRGGTQDAPLVLNAKIDAGEVDDQILDFEVLGKNRLYPLELYRKAEKKLHSSEVAEIENVRRILKKGLNPFGELGYTHESDNFNDGVLCSSYKLLATMEEKVQHMMELVEKLRSADAQDIARLVVERHFIRDLRGNLRGFSSQEFRCVKCNKIVRRPPLKGGCPVCKGKLIFTINEGGIRKYLEPALSLALKYNLSPYLKQNLELTKRYVDSIFGKETEKQTALGGWF